MRLRLARAAGGAALLVCMAVPARVEARLAETRTLSGTLPALQGLRPGDLVVEARWSSGKQRTSAGRDGRFRMVITRGAATLRVTGPGLRTLERRLLPGDEDLDLSLELATQQLTAQPR